MLRTASVTVPGGRGLRRSRMGASAAGCCSIGTCRGPVGLDRLLRWVGSTGPSGGKLVDGAAAAALPGALGATLGVTWVRAAAKVDAVQGGTGPGGCGTAGSQRLGLHAGGRDGGAATLTVGCWRECARESKAAAIGAAESFMGQHAAHQDMGHVLSCRSGASSLLTEGVEGGRCVRLGRPGELVVHSPDRPMPKMAARAMSKLVLGSFMWPSHLAPLEALPEPCRPFTLDVPRGLLPKVASSPLPRPSSSLQGNPRAAAAVLSSSELAPPPRSLKARGRMAMSFSAAPVSPKRPASKDASSSPSDQLPLPACWPALAEPAGWPACPSQARPRTCNASMSCWSLWLKRLHFWTSAKASIRSLAHLAFTSS
mmetsp:Transcript_72075/g.233140  ORF Transcript_72075/g.233140 Transcript_72075/m.233140 type:complete len:370 (+) Transcript_72075:867-1976(+)